MAFRHVKVTPSPSITDTDSLCDACTVASLAEPPLYSPKILLWFPVLIMLAIMASVLLAATCYSLIRLLSLRRRTSREIYDDGDGDSDVENQSPIHHIWHITTVGLEESVINSITVCKYSKSEGLIEETDCMVCLSEFSNGEYVRLLPKCRHAFHLPCIDTWLRSHDNCPLCRASIVSNVMNSTSMNTNRDSSDAVDETQMRNLEIDAMFERNWSIRIGSDESDGSVMGEDSILDADDETGKDVSSALVNYGYRVHSDLSDNHRSGERGDGVNDADR